MCASPAGTHRMAYWEWGDPDNDNVVLCVHGLTRTGRDFDLLARSLCNDYRVVCPDVTGRGKSDWLIQSSGYAVPQYVADMLTLIARLNPVRLDWVGTSMGGLIGLGLAGALAMSTVMRPNRGDQGLPADQTLKLGKMVLNDIGPTLNVSGLSRIADYVGDPMQFDTFDQAVDYVHSVSQGFGPHDRAGWEDLTRYVFLPQGKHWVKHYDLRISEPMAAQSAAFLQSSEAILWAAYEGLQAPVLIVHGELSDLLTENTAQEMLRRNPLASLHQVAGVGHAPTLRTQDQIGSIQQFLRS
ncbi:MAG: alpha/beta hydrolase [Burkholderiaceae bacterium]|nr:alpha/beta hydrolase [Burkholderiaceae bacterium]